MTLRRLSALAAVFALASAPMAMAQTPVREACKADIEKFCASEMAAKDRDAVRACMKANYDKLSPDCKTAIQASMSAMKPQGH